jgi:hypothetical protein
MVVRSWTHICEYSTVDGAGKISVFGILDQLKVPVLPYKYPLFHVTSGWEGTPGERFLYQIRLLSPDKQCISESTPDGTEMRLGERTSFTTLSRFFSISLDTPGDYSIEIWVDHHLIWVTSLRVIVDTIGLMYRSADEIG